MKKMLTLITLLGLVLSLASGGLAQGEVPTQLVLGMVPSREADRMVDSLDPIATLMSNQLLIPVETFVSTDYSGLVEAMRTGQVDIGMFGPFALVQAMDRANAEPILASVRRGSTSYRAQFNIRCDSGIEDFEALRGATMAFVDPNSASGYLFPYVFLNNLGINPDADMDYIFAGSHDASALAVYNGDVDVGVTFGGSPGSDGRETIQADYADVKDVVCILGYTGDIPNDGVVVRAGLDPELVTQIQQTMIDIAEDEEGQVHTEALFNVTAFAPTSAEAYDIVRETARIFD